MWVLLEVLSSPRLPDDSDEEREIVSGSRMLTAEDERSLCCSLSVLLMLALMAAMLEMRSDLVLASMYALPEPLSTDIDRLVYLLALASAAGVDQFSCFSFSASGRG